MGSLRARATERRPFGESCRFARGATEGQTHPGRSLIRRQTASDLRFLVGPAGLEPTTE